LGKRVKLSRLVRDVDAEDSVSLSYVASLQPLAPLNLVLALPLLSKQARSKSLSMLCMVVSLMILLSVPNTYARIVGSIVVAVLISLVLVRLSMTELIVRLFVILVACYMATFMNIANLVKFLTIVQLWMSKGVDSIIAVYIPSMLILELYDVAKVLSCKIKLLEHLSNPLVTSALLFAIFLFIASILLGLGCEVYAERFAELAYVSLAIAVIYQVYTLARSREQ